MRIIITGGGTGGHVFPALEIIKELRRKSSDADVVWVGNKKSREEKIAKQFDIPFFGLSAKQVVGQKPWQKLIALFYLGWAVFVSLWFLIKQRPKAVIGVGGYVSVPILLASFLLGIRRYICEQNVAPGFANKNLAKIAHRVFISFKESERFFKSQKTLFSGNPVREEFFSACDRDNQCLRILVTGGSLGARFLNHHVPTVLGGLKNDYKIQVTHQTGQKERDEVNERYQAEGVNACVVPFIEDMPQAFSSHNLLISRAGATVCAEIMASGMPSILVPYPYAGSHQRYNALALKNLCAAIVIEQEDDFINRLTQSLKTLYGDQKALMQLANNAKKMAIKNAAEEIVTCVLKDIQKRK